ncbi:MAG: hypothetical protein LBK46_05440 [Oscillospiraceae bacterium]|nr:hypothetical protein [Oscillospiraceae bacterium]
MDYVESNNISAKSEINNIDSPYFIQGEASLIPDGTVSRLLDVLTALSDAQTYAAFMTELQSEALDRALGITGSGMWPNAEEAVDSIDHVRSKMLGVADPLACALCCVTNTLTADNCKKIESVGPLCAQSQVMPTSTSWNISENNCALGSQSPPSISIAIRCDERGGR